MTEDSGPGAAGERVFLVVVDETEEMRAALRFACRRAQHTGGRVALLHVIEPLDGPRWLGVGEVMEDEQRREAEKLLTELGAEVYALTRTIPVLHIREGGRRDQALALLDEEPNVSILVLGTASGRSDPGPLVSHLVSLMGTKIRVPITLVPGHLTADEIDAFA